MIAARQLAVSLAALLMKAEVGHKTITMSFSKIPKRKNSRNWWQKQSLFLIMQSFYKAVAEVGGAYMTVDKRS